MFEKEKMLNTVLYVVNQLGGTCDIHRLSKTLYFADRNHLSKYGRSITDNEYIAMQYGPVPNEVYQIFNALRGKSYFSNSDLGKELKTFFTTRNSETIVALINPDMDYLSESDIECLNEAITLCKDKSFNELKNLSQDYAWHHTILFRTLSIRDILTEMGDDDEYISYIEEQLKQYEFAK